MKVGIVETLKSAKGTLSLGSTMNQYPEEQLELVEVEPPKTNTEKLEELLAKMDLVLTKIKARKARKMRGESL